MNTENSWFGCFIQEYFSDLTFHVISENEFLLFMKYYKNWNAIYDKYILRKALVISYYFI